MLGTYIQQVHKLIQGKGGKIQWAVSWFQKLYRVEQALKDKTKEERYVTRQSNTQSLLNEFKAW